MFDSKNFKQYRQKLGFNNKLSFSDFLSAKDIQADIDFNYIELLNTRIKDIFYKINNVSFIKQENIELFLQNNLNNVFNQLKQNGILNKLNNQGRRKEEVYFSWIRGYLMLEYFKPAIAKIFSVNIDNIQSIGDDDFSNIDTFKRTPKADLQINHYRIEVQSGFKGINDIKQHKVLEAKRIYLENKIETIVLHFDLFNGQVAFVNISNIAENDLNWITRQQMEGQTVFNIDPNYFKWLITDDVPKLENILD
ncbi:MAG: hypothetical protein IKZ88_01860 [Neisseriaceae bacterium]|nr:hypothetical protein [Neisseriaceae bacterium]